MNLVYIILYNIWKIWNIDIIYIYIYIYIYMNGVFYVTLCGWSAKQTIPSSVLARNQTKAWVRDLWRDRKWARERESVVGKRNSKKAVGEGWHRRAVDNGQQKEAVRKGQSRCVSIPCGFVEISRRMHVSVSPRMHRECSVTNHPSCTLSWPKPLLFVCSLFFFSHSVGCISCGHKEMCDVPINH